MQEYFIQQIAANKGIIYKICRSFCRNKTDQDDLRQEILLQLWKGLPKYDAAYSFTTWMYRVALNVAISYYRRQKRNTGTMSLPDGFAAAAAEYEAEEADSPMMRLQQHVAALKELEKALMLLYFEERSYREIAAIMGITETNVATKVSRIKEKLKQAILNDKKTEYGRS